MEASAISRRNRVRLRTPAVSRREEALTANAAHQAPVHEGRARRPKGADAPPVPSKLPRPVVVLLVSLFIPWTVTLGSLAITPYRLVLITMIGPAFVKWASGKAGRIRIADIALLLFSLWAIVALVVNHGPQPGLQSGGINLIETMGGYMMARVYIRNADDFHKMSKLLFGMVVFFLPFAFLESVSGRPVAMELFSHILPGHTIAFNEPRLGFRRVQGVFEHPILFGVASGSILAITHLVLARGKSWWVRWSMTGMVAMSVLLSLSSGPISSTIAQAMLLGWGWALGAIRARWKILMALVGLAYLMVAMFAKRSVPEILFSSFALDVQSAYFRLLIWNFGSASAMNHPWFGTGFGPWERPSWMGPSIDMYWLYNAIVFGLPAAFFMLVAFFSALITTGAKRGLDDKLYAYRSAYLIAMIGMFLVGWTVHFWGSVYILFLFLLGSGMWFADVSVTEESASPNKRAARNGRLQGARRGLEPTAEEAAPTTRRMGKHLVGIES